MAGEKSNKAKHDPASRKTGNSCGFSLGCFIIVIAVAAVFFFLFLKPALEESGYSFAELKEKLLNLKEKADKTLNRTDEVYQTGKEKYEDVKEKAEEHWDDLRKLDDQGREKLNKNAPQLISD